jgi:hypothetical protein
MTRQFASSVTIHLPEVGGGPDYYQIMPDAQAETMRQGMGAFWDWHMAENQQWFETPVEAAEAFVKAWGRWLEKGARTK